MSGGDLVALAERGLAHARGEALVTVTHERSLLSRFARSRPTQATDVDELSVEVTCVRDGRLATAGAVGIDDVALRDAAGRAAAAAEAAARAGPGSYPGLPGPDHDYRPHDGWDPDTAELVRAKAARIGADFTTLMSVLIGLPLGYHRDLQEDKEPLFDAAGTLELTLPAMIGAIETIRFDVEAMRAACEDDGLYATDIAEALVGEGVPFREAHRRTGELLRSLGDRRLKDLSKEEWHSFGLSEGADLLDPERSVAARSGPGGPSPGSVEEQAAAIERSLTERRS